MSDTKKYYWLKLKENFFEDDTIQWLEEQDNGKEYVLFYLKLCLRSLKTEGSIVRYVGEMLIPYDIKTLSKVTNTDIDTVIVAIELFNRIGLIDMRESGEIYLNQINEMVGSETSKAELMRRKRTKERLDGNIVTKMLPECYPEIELEKEIEIDKEYIVQQVADIWKAYPNKKGKTDSIKKITKLLKDNNTDTILQAIDRYKNYVEERRKTFKEFQYQNGSTFFNKGIEDYIGEEYEESIQETKPKGWWKLD